MTTCATPECGAILGPKNRSGLCKPCVTRRTNADPAFQAKRRAGLAAHFADPKVKAAWSERMAEFNRNPTDEERERRRQHGYRQAKRYLLTPEHQAKCNSPEARQKKGATISARAFAGFTEAERLEVRRIVTSGQANSADARRMVKEQSAAAERKRLAALSPLERQLERVRAGAAVSERVPMPSRQLAHTPGGVATGML